MLETTQKVKLADLQIESLKRSRQRADLTTLEIKVSIKQIFQFSLSPERLKDSLKILGAISLPARIRPPVSHIIECDSCQGTYIFINSFAGTPRKYNDI